MRTRRSRIVLAHVLAVCVVGSASDVFAQQGPSIEVRNDSIRVRLSNTDLRAAIQAFNRFLTKPVLTSTLGEVRVEFFETPVPVHPRQIPDLLRGLAEAHGLAFTEDSTFYRIAPLGEAAPGRRASREQVAEADTARAPLRLFTVRLKHARAGDVASTLNQLYGTGSTFSRPGLSRGSLSDELRADREALGRGGRAETQAPPEPEGATLRGTVTIVPDELTNSLLIRATDADYETLMEGVAQLDVRPLQVMIEVIAVETRKDRQFALGFDVSVPAQNLGDGEVEGSLLGAGLGDLVIRVMNLGREEINARLTAARQRGDVEIISRPVITASNNTEARILVGTQQPFVQVSRSLPTDTPQRDQVVQYRDVGTSLTVLPTINQDGYVSLLIQQELSQATGETQFSAPVISSRETMTQVLVADGQTIVLGGLRDRVQDEVRTGVPLLSDIPLIGGLFGGTRKRTTETELFLFITPTILGDDAAVDAATRARWPRAMKNDTPGRLPPDSTGAGATTDTLAVRRQGGGE